MRVPRRLLRLTPLNATNPLHFQWEAPMCDLHAQATNTLHGIQHPRMLTFMPSDACPHLNPVSCIGRQSSRASFCDNPQKRTSNCSVSFRDTTYMASKCPPKPTYACALSSRLPSSMARRRLSARVRLRFVRLSLCAPLALLLRSSTERLFLSFNICNRPRFHRLSLSVSVAPHGLFYNPTYP